MKNKTHFDAELISRIKYIRQLSNLSRPQLVELMNKSAVGEEYAGFRTYLDYIRKYEEGVFSPNLQFINLFRKVFGLKWEWLLTGKGTKYVAGKSERYNVTDKSELIIVRDYMGYTVEELGEDVTFEEITPIIRAIENEGYTVSIEANSCHIYGNGVEKFQITGSGSTKVEGCWKGVVEFVKFNTKK